MLKEHNMPTFKEWIKNKSWLPSQFIYILFS
jgi:hypothetical protein